MQHFQNFLTHLKLPALTHLKFAAETELKRACEVRRRDACSCDDVKRRSVLCRDCLGFWERALTPADGVHTNCCTCATVTGEEETVEISFQ